MKICFTIPPFLLKKSKMTVLSLGGKMSFCFSTGCKMKQVYNKSELLQMFTFSYTLDNLEYIMVFLVNFPGLYIS